MNWNTPNNEIKTFRLNPINAMIWPKAERFAKFQMPVPTESIDLSRFGNVKFWYNFWFHPEKKSFQIIYIHINMFETLFPHSAILWCVFFVVLVKRIFFLWFSIISEREKHLLFIFDLHIIGWVCTVNALQNRFDISCHKSTLGCCIVYAEVGCESPLQHGIKCQCRTNQNFVNMCV